MLAYRKISDAAESAYQKGEFFEFMTGQSGYHYPCPDVHADVPTDWTRVIPAGIYNLYNRTKDPQIIRDYEKAIRKALWGSAWDFWCAANILFFQREKEKQGKSPFTIDSGLCREAGERMEKIRLDLEQEFPYGRKDLTMLQDINGLENNFAEDWGEGLFDQER